MNDIVLEETKIKDKIYEIRGKQVMLDSDLASIYKCKNGTKTINQAVNRHLDRFPEDFYFQLTWEEFYILKSQFGTSSSNEYGGIRKLPYVFTEQGVAMLATIIKTQVAAQVSINIMRAFVAMRKYIALNSLEQSFINNLVLEDHDRIEMLESIFKNFEEKKKINDIYFDGQNYDAYYRIQEIFNKTKDNLIIIDSYADNKLLNIIKRLKVNVIIITKENNLLTKQDINEYNKQYKNLKVIYNKTFHDRYFILDKKEMYHCGTSINSIGNKTFSINMITDKEVIELLINRIDKVIEGK